MGSFGEAPVAVCGQENQQSCGLRLFEAIFLNFCKNDDTANKVMIFGVLIMTVMKHTKI